MSQAFEADDSAAFDASIDDVPLPPEPAFSGGGATGGSSRSNRFDDDRRRGEVASRGTDYGRELPHSIEAEQGVLGGMLLNPQAVADVYEILRPEDFYRPAHQLVYQAILHLYGESSEVDPILVAGRLDRLGELERVGGAPYLHTLMSMVPTAANAHYYAKIVAEKALVRRLVEAGTQITQIAYAGAEDAEPEVLVDQAQQLIFGVGRDNEKTDYSSLSELLDPTLAELEKISEEGGLAQGIPTGFSRLDELTNGLHGGQMVIIAARPGVGKSTLALDFMRSASITHGKASVIFSLEMSKIEIMMRMLSAETKINLAKLRSGRMEEKDWAKLVERTEQIADVPLFIDDSPNMTMMEIRAKARQLKQKHDLGLIVVDYLQLMSSGKKVESRQQEVSEFSRQLKLLAKEVDVPLIAISQLNRGPESRTDKKPQVSDLRESGSLEQDADMVMLLYRPDSQDESSERAGEADIILAKHRGGPIGTIAVAHQLHYSRFVDLAPEH
ncbi:replicative DNA helicase [Corynebacterium sp. H113]|uniref:replicative DNA helicase n=1 Tax=Corynebacterium sp. H113 TaxID=3133419 RepID=UPI00309ABD24